MKNFVFLALFLVSSCVYGNLEDSGKGFAAEIEKIRQSKQPYVFIQGGFYDGAAWDQEVQLIVEPDDKLTCVFTNADSNSANHTTVFFHGETTQVPRLFEAVASLYETPTILGSRRPEITSFIYERRLKNGSTFWLEVSQENGRVGKLNDFFLRNPHSCWNWG